MAEALFCELRTEVDKTDYIFVPMELSYRQKQTTSKPMYDVEGVNAGRSR